MKLDRKQVYRIIAGLLAVVILVGGVVLGVLIFEKKVIAEQDKARSASLVQSDPYADLYIYDNGKKYRPKSGLSTILLIGLDTFGEMKASNSYNNEDLCDFITLLIFDSFKEECNVIQVNRDTMTDIPVLAVNGQKAGTVNGQIALAHSYGTGMHDSCVNVVEATENLLYNIDIQKYICVNMDAVSKMNDLVGGVTVEVLDDFYDVPELVKGQTVTLTGELALKYVRGRMSTGDGTNISRMARQRQYMLEFVNQLRNAYINDSNLAINMYKSVTKYMISDCSATDFQSFAQSFSNYKMNEIYVPKGESKVGAVYMEHYVDDAALKELVISLFYDEVPQTSTNS